MQRGGNSVRAGRGETVAALERGIAVLHCLGEAAGPLSHGDLARRTGIPKPTVTRLVATLVGCGYLRQMPDGEKYVLGPGVLSLARTFLTGMDIRHHARPHMARLADRVGGTVFLAVRDQLEMVVVEACRSRSTVLLSRLDVGSRLALLTSAMGRAYLNSLSADERQDLLARLRKAEAGDWKKRLAGAERAWRTTGRRGFCLSLGEWHPDISSAATTLRAPDGEWLALNCGGPAFQFSEERLRREIAPLLLQTARAIAEEIGGAAPERPGLRLVAAGR